MEDDRPVPYHDRMSGDGDDEIEYVRVRRALADDYMDGIIDAGQYGRALRTLEDPRVEADLGVRMSWTGVVAPGPDGSPSADDEDEVPLPCTDIDGELTVRDVRRMMRRVQRLTEAGGDS